MGTFENIKDKIWYAIQTPADRMSSHEQEIKDNRQQHQDPWDDTPMP